MDADAVFRISNLAALIGWVSLLFAWAAPIWPLRIAGLAVPALLSVGYTGLILAFWSRAEGGFGTLGEVMTLFTSREIVLAGWVHYLAFDLFVGAWEVGTARREGIAFLLVAPCLALTFLFGPAGFLAFTALRAARAAQAATRETGR